ncbi:hypothetical protein KDW_24570 [Dictyobacter vulcani]|uniref:peptidylprolyl isomerase n=1 Tax=Dictyobacter vulcani TaxID=2607529 RepID=A0A5J4KKC5_9CHLR|nr:peptidylprolyl isomerase [Dictyobacter vulcani]GER88295.1 hypothetical protein KDW_24570 [Dictyobacter vulcani]
MPKTTKRAEARRAAKITRAHSTQLPDLEVNNSGEHRRNAPGYKAPARGLARYPWASIIILCLLLAGIFAVLYVNHYPPFAQAKNTAVATPKAAATASAATPAAKPTSAVSSVTDPASPCAVKDVVSGVTNTGVALSADAIKKINHKYSSAENVIDNNKIYCAGINTNRGLIVVELDPKLAPKTVNNFVFLAQRHFYDGLTFHRVVKDFVAQGGDPTGSGSGGPGYQFADEPVQGSYTDGTIAMANSGPNTNGSQFFISIADNSSKLGKQYNLFGHVVQGLNVAKQLNQVENGSGKADTMNYVIVKAVSK